MEIRPANERGSTRLAWLNSRHSFSFGYYYDPARLGVAALRVINDDWVAPGAGFDTHGHRDMEIISYVIAGELVHQDSMGNHFALRTGDIQLMRAGTGVSHSEFNGSKTEAVRFLQIWIQPSQKNLAPHYEQLNLANAAGSDGWINVAAPVSQQAEGVKVAQDVWIWCAKLQSERRSFTLAEGRQAYIHVVDGRVSINEQLLNAGDAALVTQAGVLECEGSGEFLLFDLIN